MTINTFARLDQTELLQLAMKASAADDGGTAIAYLKEATARADASAFAHYMLGAEYAQITLYERAVNAMEAALALDPALVIARFQLGLLWLTMGENARADQVFGPLAELPTSDPLNRYAAGLQHLIHGRREDCLRCLGEGLALHSGNAALNEDMQRMRVHLQATGGAAPGAPAPGTASGAGATADAAGQAEEAFGARHVLISAYTGQAS
jgi:tetratricopeptide (TPR) repeat protein